MIVRKEQIDALAHHQAGHFVRRLERILVDALPEYFHRMPQQERHELVARLVEEAFQRGVNIQNDTANYVQLRIEVGAEFDEALNSDPEFCRAMDDRAITSIHKLAMIEQRFFSLK